MHSSTKVIERGDQIALQFRNRGRMFAWLVAIEVALLGALMVPLAAVLPDVSQLMLPGVVAAALVLWTGLQMKSDYRIIMDLAAREGRIVRTAPISGARTATTFPLDEVEALALRQTVSRRFWNEYVVALELRGGGRHVLSERGPLLAYEDYVARFSRATGIGSRVVRLPTA
jgi:hypothetical protein